MYKTIRRIDSKGTKTSKIIAGITRTINPPITVPKDFLRGFFGLSGNCSFVLLVTGETNDINLIKPFLKKKIKVSI
jgi:hypothetical protein